MKTARKLAIIITSLATMLVVAPAQAAPDLASLQDRALAGTLTTYDRSYLAGHPEIAGVLIDGTATRTGVVNYSDAQVKAAMSSSELATITATTYCSGTDRYQIHSSLLGSTIFRYHSYVYWCWTGSLTTVRNHYPYFDQMQSVVVDKGNLVKQVRRISGSTYETHHQNYVQLCTLGRSLGTICYANLYPTNWVTVSNKTGSTFRHDI